MRRKAITRFLAGLAAITLTLWLINPTWAESGCHKVKGKGGNDTKTVQPVIS